MAHVAASLSARPVLHHRFADTARAARDEERRRWRVLKRERYETRTREMTRRGGGKEKAVSESLRIVPRDEPARLSLPTNGAHILISTRSPSYYWLEINRPFRG